MVFVFFKKKNVPSVVGMHVCFPTAKSLKNESTITFFCESLNHDNLK